MRVTLASTNFPSTQLILLSFPSLGALITCSIFMASKATKLSPFLTVCPTLTKILLTVDGIGDFTVGEFDPNELSSVIPYSTGIKS